MEDRFDLDQEFDIVELEPRGAASPDGQVVVVANNVGSGGGSGGSHAGSPSGKFLGPTKGNSDLPIDRTKGTGGGKGGAYKAGGAN